MPRQARKKSESGIYHIMLRGINRQTIFEDSEDSEVFLETIRIYKPQFNCEVHAYCLMNNHVHLLIKIDSEAIQHFMRRLGAKYVYWYNWKYNRVGGLFQDRYKSEPVEDDGYFLTVLRYIHQNPVKAGICSQVEEYQYSSYHDYVHPKSNQLTDTGFALGMMNKGQFVEFNHEDNDDKCLEMQEITRLNDNEAKAIIYKISQCQTTSDFQALPEEQRKKYLRSFKSKGLSVRQIERLTEINRGVVLKA